VPLPAKLPGGNNVKVIVLVDHQALLRGHTLAGETSEIAGIGPVSVTAVRQILRDDPFLAVAIRNGRDIVNVAHHGRGLNAHQRTAIEATGLRCTNQACNQTIAIEIDHRVAYATNNETKLDNQDPLCGGCHRLKTHHGHHLEPGTGPRRLLPPGHPDNPLTPHRGEDTAPEPDTGRTTRAVTDPASSPHPPRVEQPTLC
jgi:5-methylcytosine-specific restriction endonuclease McrA